MRAGLHSLYFIQCYCFWIQLKRWRYAISYTRNRRMRWHGDTEYLISQGMSNLNGNTCEVRKRISLYKNLLYQLRRSFTSAICICNSAWMQLHNKVKCFTFLCGWPLFTSPFALKRNKRSTTNCVSVLLWNAILNMCWSCLFTGIYCMAEASFTSNDLSVYSELKSSCLPHDGLALDTIDIE